MTRTQYPSYGPALRIAVLTSDLGLREIRRRMARSRTVAATPALLCQLAEAVEAGSIELPRPDAAVIVFTGICRGELTGLERDLFWRVFQVPVFEQLLSPDGRILAMECDVHEGMHLLDPAQTAPEFEGFLETSLCGCGNPHPRLMRSTAASRVGAPVPAYVYKDGNQQNQQVDPARRVA